MRRRSALFMPGNNPGMLQSGGIHGADGIILDLEDAVPADSKDSARTLVKHALSTLKYPCQVLVRVNGITTPHWEADIQAVVPCRPDVLVIPKCESTQEMQDWDLAVRKLERQKGIVEGSIRFMCLIESPLGVRNGFEIAKATPRVESLALGCADLTAELGTQVSLEGTEVAYAMGKMLMDARAAGVYAYDTAYADVENIDGLVARCQISKQMGYDGRPVISPSHVEIVNTLYCPSQKEIESAMEIILAAEEGIRKGRGAISLNGAMIDAPILKRARQVLELAKLMKGGNRYENGSQIRD